MRAAHDPLMLHSDAEVAEMRRSAVSKAAWRFLPVLTIAYILNYSNVPASASPH